MASSPICIIDEFGIRRPDFSAVQAYFQAAYRAIYGDDVYLGNDSQDGQWVDLIATALSDANAATVAAYNARSPVSAQGVGLSSIAKINGLSRATATRSSVDLRIVGQAGTLIINGTAGDVAGTTWVLPSSVTIPIEGEITVTGLAAENGNVLAPAGSITAIQTPTQGWQEVSNLAAATPGLPIETDAALRQRQVLSTMLPARTVLQGATAAVAAVSGVARLRVYENDLDRMDAIGVPGHGVAFVVDGGDAAAVAAVIAARKGPGVSTYGSTVISVDDALGVARRIAFSRPVSVPVTYAIQLRALPGYNLDIQTRIAEALASWTVGLGIGAGRTGALLSTRAFGPALLPGDAGAGTFEILSLSVARDGGLPGFADVPFAFDEAPICSAALVAFAVVS